MWACVAPSGQGRVCAALHVVGAGARAGVCGACVARACCAGAQVLRRHITLPVVGGGVGDGCVGGFGGVG